ncbi:hypothetical protein [Streptomyces sp. RTGN2]|uniref:hypothetical protein n=1 Tax=Streptomyces sp. RTGN2 TaxID=3016525 RepID=UPI002552EC55|nr:hypothetical protein [Streptomyces sp. RTGN2]
MRSASQPGVQAEAAGIPDRAGEPKPASARAEPTRRPPADDEQARAGLGFAGHTLGPALPAVAGVTDAAEAILGSHLADWAS